MARGHGTTEPGSTGTARARPESSIDSVLRGRRRKSLLGSYSTLLPLFSLGRGAHGVGGPHLGNASTKERDDRLPFLPPRAAQLVGFRAISGSGMLERGGGGAGREKVRSSPRPVDLSGSSLGVAGFLTAGRVAVHAVQLVELEGDHHVKLIQLGLVRGGVAVRRKGGRGHRGVPASVPARAVPAPIPSGSGRAPLPWPKPLSGGWKSYDGECFFPAAVVP